MMDLKSSVVSAATTGRNGLGKMLQCISVRRISGIFVNREALD